MTSTSDICDEYQGSIQLIPTDFKSFGGSDSISADIETIETTNIVDLKDFLKNNDGNRKVLFIDGASAYQALVDKEVAELAINQNWRGLVVNGYVRHCRVLKSYSLGIWALGSCPAIIENSHQSLCSGTLNFYGLDIRPGMHLYIDEDGAIITTTRVLKNDASFNTWLDHYGF